MAALYPTANNYRKSLSVLRSLEEQYNLISLAQDNKVSKRQHNGVTGETGNDIQQNYITKNNRAA